MKTTYFMQDIKKSDLNLGSSRRDRLEQVAVIVGLILFVLLAFGQVMSAYRDSAVARQVMFGDVASVERH